MDLSPRPKCSPICPRPFFLAVPPRPSHPHPPHLILILVLAAVCSSRPSHTMSYLTSSPIDMLAQRGSRLLQFFIMRCRWTFIRDISDPYSTISQGLAQVLHQKGLSYVS
ncbi:hypothetical protein YC2023_037452 [Brassica napus]